MFTGIVECTGRVLSCVPVEKGARYAIGIPFADELSRGESVAVNGCCLTVDRVAQGQAEFDLLAQTLRVTSLGRLKPDSPCNLERAMAANGRFGGHLVMGHVDAAGEVVSVDAAGQDHIVRIRIPDSCRRYVIDKGSIAIDGVSLTIASISDGGVLEFWITPHTWQRTVMHAYAPGSMVNLETDMVAKYIETMLGARR